MPTPENKTRIGVTLSADTHDVLVNHVQNTNERMALGRWLSALLGEIVESIYGVNSSESRLARTLTVTPLESFGLKHQKRAMAKLVRDYAGDGWMCSACEASVYDRLPQYDVSHCPSCGAKITNFDKALESEEE